MPDISYDHPIPRQGRSPKYPFSEVKPGGSFFVPDRTPAHVSYQSYQYRQLLKQRDPKAVMPVFVSRVVVEDGVKGVRCWRVS